jgi:hypothetical protein
LFWGRGARFFSESPIEHYFAAPESERDAFLVWFFIRYLVPYDLVFAADYYVWRLGKPSPVEIAERHIAIHRSGAGTQWASPPLPERAPTGGATLELPVPRVFFHEYRNQVGLTKAIQDRDLIILDRDRTIMETIAEHNRTIAERNAAITELAERLSDFRAAARRIPGLYRLLKHSVDKRKAR